MNVKIIANQCIGCGLCANTCPAVFRLNDKFIAEVIPEAQIDHNTAAIKTAAKNCPVAAIAIEE